jgi:aminomethyltransferase
VNLGKALISILLGTYLDRANMPPTTQSLARFTQTLHKPKSSNIFEKAVAIRCCYRPTRTYLTTPNRQPSPSSRPNQQPLNKLQTQPPKLRNASTTTASSELKQTPLYDLHATHNAKFGPFAGYTMPLTYPPQSHVDSHLWTRSKASLFDVSHMVQHKLSGPLAEEFLMTITPSALDSLPKHTSTLSCLLQSDGGIVDDTVITRLGRDSFYFVTNAGRRQEDLTFIQDQMDTFLASKANSSKSEDEKPIVWHVLNLHSLLALQGPLSAKILQPMIHSDPDDTTVNTDLSTMYFGHSRWFQLDLPETCTKEHTSLSTPSLLISRTGYTGEDGFEISIPPENGSSLELATSIAKAFLSATLDRDEPVCKLAGLAARDSLRLEAGMCLYGHDIDESTTPPVAGLGWTVAKSRRGGSSSPSFNGKETIAEQLSSPKTMPRRRVGLTIQSGPAAREGATIVSLTEDGKEAEKIGEVTSGCPSPSMGGKNIGMGYVKSGFHKSGTKVGVLVRGKMRTGEVVKMPFVESRFYRGYGEKS